MNLESRFVKGCLRGVVSAATFIDDDTVAVAGHERVVLWSSKAGRESSWHFADLIPRGVRFWGTAGSGWLIANGMAWRYEGELTLGQPTVLPETAVDVSVTGNDIALAAASNWIAKVFDGAVRVLRRAPPTTSAELIEVLTSWPATNALSLRGGPAEDTGSNVRLVANAGGTRFGVVTAGSSHSVVGAGALVSVDGKPDGHPTSGAMTTSGTLVAAASRQLEVFLIGDGGSVPLVHHPIASRVVSFHPTDTVLAYVGHVDRLAHIDPFYPRGGELVLWDYLSGEARCLPLEGLLDSQTLEFSPLGSLLLVGVGEGGARIIDYEAIRAEWSKKAVPACETPKPLGLLGHLFFVDDEGLTPAGAMAVTTYANSWRRGVRDFALERLLPVLEIEFEAIRTDKEWFERWVDL